jgi:hypothetical protein
MYSKYPLTSTIISLAIFLASFLSVFANYKQLKDVNEGFSNLSHKLTLYIFKSSLINHVQVNIVFQCQVFDHFLVSEISLI